MTVCTGRAGYAAAIGTFGLTDRSTKGWKGETGLVDKERLSRHLTTLQGPIYYIAGPPAMVAGVRKVLLASDVDEDDIRTEDFAGY